MRFNDIEPALRDNVSELMCEHLSSITQMLAKDKYLMPMLAIYKDAPESNQLVGLQPRESESDVDKAYDYVVQKLKSTDFKYAIFFYSTQICLEGGKQTTAVKSTVFTGNGPAIVFYTPYSVNGLLKRKVEYGRIAVADIIPNAI